LSDVLEKLYSIYRWVEDPFKEDGWRRYLEIIEVFRKVTAHQWLRDLIGGREVVKIIDFCSGTGIGGVALAKLVKDLGLGVEITLVDLRRDALEIARKFVEKELGVEARVIVADVRDRILFKEKHDIALLWGLSTSHFSPWDLLKLFSNAASSLADDGLFIFEEVDRVYSVFYRVCYKDFLVENSYGDSVVISIHLDKDPLNGYFERLMIDLGTGEKVRARTYFWDIAGSSTIAWVLFRDVDFIPVKSKYSGVVLAKGPRRVVDTNVFLTEKPRIINT